MECSMTQVSINFLWNLDSDEIFRPEDIEKLLLIMRQEGYTSAGFKSFSFFGGFDHYLTGFEEEAEFKRVFRVFPGSTWKKHRPPTVKHEINVSLRHLDFDIL